MNPKLMPIPLPNTGSRCSPRLAAALMLAALGACGCGVPTPSSEPSTSSPQPSAPLPQIQGNVRGGQQPVGNASILLYAAGSTGPGVGAVNLLVFGVSTDSSGNFSVTGDYTCPSASTQVYVVAQGGNPGLAAGTDNHALLMMAPLGDCGVLSSATRIDIDEVTTAASAWALSQFLGPGAMVGSSATNASGLDNAFALAKNLVDTGTGLAPGPTLPAGAVTESAKLYDLADALASCVNSDGGTACNPLFAAAATAQGAPANTLDAALNIVRHPGSNIAAVFAAAGTHGPFQPVLAAPPSDWTMSLTYSGGGLNLPGSLAIDSAGNVAVANYFGAAVSKFSPTGVPAFAAGIPGAGLNQSYGIAIDASNNIWVANEQSVTAAANHHYGSVSQFSPAGVELSGYGYTGGGVYYPLALAADADGEIWAADYGSSSATLLAANGSAVSTANGFAPAALAFTSAVAIDGDHNAWFAVQTGAARVTSTGAASSFACCAGPAGIAVDPSGNVWVADYSGSAVVELAPSGVIANHAVLSGGNVGPQGIAVDGAGNVWAADYYGDSLAELSSTAAVLSPYLGFGLDSAISEPYGVAIDAGGDLWLSNSGSNTLTEIVGLASPVKTPLLGPPVQP